MALGSVVAIDVGVADGTAVDGVVGVGDGKALEQWRRRPMVWLQRLHESAQLRWERLGDVASRLRIETVVADGLATRSLKIGISIGYDSASGDR